MTDNGNPATQPHEISDPASDHATWQLQKAVEFWPPAVEKADFCHRRRKGEMAGMTKIVTLATKTGNRPTPSRGKTALLVLNDWNAQYCFWTLNQGNRRYVVHLERSQSMGEHWTRWLGVQETFEAKAIAFPLEARILLLDDHEANIDVIPHITQHSPFNIPTPSYSRQTSEMEQHSRPNRISPACTSSSLRRSKRVSRPAFRYKSFAPHTEEEPSASPSAAVGQPSLILRLKLRRQQTSDTFNITASDSEEEGQSSPRRRLTRRRPSSPASMDRASSLRSLQFSDDEVETPATRPAKRMRLSSKIQNPIVLSDTEDGVVASAAVQPKTEDLDEIEQELQQQERELEYVKSRHAVLEAERKRDQLRAKAAAARAAKGTKIKTEEV
ncbi:MAG: hypothetical protein LQ343_004669 [Gyalolechia ehrenbergii]|nr:MAG: hypothetical protein LQ343_004669 [Gyalolechia ehrenbergii]